MMDLAVLGLLKQEDLHGYELKKRIAELLGASGSVSFGSLYPALARLERAGHIRVLDRARIRPASPMTGAITGELAAFRRHRAKSLEGPSLEGPSLEPAPDEPRTGLLTERRAAKRNRKVYGITERGIAHLHDLLVHGDTSDDRVFSLQVAFCSYVAPADRRTVIDRRRAVVRALLDDRARATVPTDPYRRSLQERDTQHLQRALDWLDELTALSGPADADHEPGADAARTGGTPR